MSCHSGTSFQTTRWQLLIFTVAFTARLALIIHNHYIGPLGHTEAFNVASSIAPHGTFANPYETAKTGATAHGAPFLPFLVSLLLRLLGTGTVFAIVVRVITAFGDVRAFSHVWPPHSSATTELESGRASSEQHCRFTCGWSRQALM